MPNTRSIGDELEQPVTESGPFIHLKCQIQELIAIFDHMVELDNRPLKDFEVPSQDELHSSIVPLEIQADIFELKPSLLQIVQLNQLSGNPTEDPNLHLLVFVQYADYAGKAWMKVLGYQPKLTTE